MSLVSPDPESGVPPIPDSHTNANLADSDSGRRPDQ
jgi:hypothetical protein